jgi:peptidoglycan glycosyltransferase
MAGHSRVEPQRTVADLTLRPWAPAASVFKVITSAALLATGDVSPSRRVCYHGGGSRLRRDNIVDRPRLDRRCATLAEAVGRSTNAIIAKLAHRHLDPDTLSSYVRAFGFNQAVPRSDAFPLAVTPSPATVPRDDLEFARTAAGFWHVFLSPLHGARIASAFANGGVMVAPRLVERVREPDGTVVEPVAALPQQVIPPAIAQAVGRMMIRTTRAGTARGSFLPGGHRALAYDVAGKTGSLSRAKPYTHYNWFVGFAPADKPRVAFGVLVGTDGNNVKAAAVAREVLRQAHLDAPAGDAMLARR